MVYNGGMNGQRIKKVCSNCSVSFEDYVSNKRSGFCSLKCYWEGKKNNSKYGGFWLGKKRKNMEGENNPKWLGEKVSYRNLHFWVRRHKVKSNICEFCKKSKKTDWANKSHKYLRDLNDWLELCRKCHIHYDKDFKGIATKIYGKI